MSTQRSDTPRLVFTICKVNPRDSHYEDKNPSLGLIFVDREEPLHYRRVATLMRSPLVVEMMGDFYVGGIFRWKPHEDKRYYWNEPTRPDHHDPAGDEQAIVINQRNWCTPTPQRMPDERLYVMLEGELFRTTAHDLYLECRELHRLIGCDKCPVNRDECVRRHLKFDVGQIPVPGCGLPVFRDFTSEAFEERRKRQQFCVSDIEGEWPYWKTEIEGHVYVPPGVASWSAMRPGRQIHHPFSLAFRDDTIESNRNELSERSKRAAETRNMKRKECTACYFGGKGYRGTALPCEDYAPRWCQHGAWTEEQLIDETLIAFEHQLKLSKFTVREFEQMLAIGGQTLYRPNADETGHWKYVISGLTFHGTTQPNMRIELQRVAADARGGAFHFTSVKEFLPTLSKDLRRIFDEAPTLSREVRAIAAQLTCAQGLAPYVCMQGCIREVQPGISHLRALNGYCVEVGYWLRSYWRSLTITSLLDLYNDRSFRCLPMFDIHRAPKEGVLDFRFHHWPRR